ncbi:hypothetical protein SLE2022_179750 [Rubroshorea leprosula]
MDFPNPRPNEALCSKKISSLKNDGPYSPPEASKSNGQKAKTQSSPLACDGLIIAILSGENTTVNLSASCRVSLPQSSNEEISVHRSSKLAEMGGAEHGHGHGHGAEGFRRKVWSMSGGPYCRPEHWRRNTGIAMFGVFLICIPIAMKSAELEV